ncbi:MAG: hypothetical protein JWO07_189 [Candidatus Saccharibacteria bacterium]|nr:hypothetical protein [Candidatus Saccharibacteria bacterium]
MATASNLESTIGGWYKSVPHLPKAGQEWLAENVWWLALIGAIVSVLGLLVVIPLFLGALALTSVVTTANVGYGMYGGGYGGLYWLSTLISIVSYILTTVLLVMSVSQLKVHKKKGWTLLFWSYLISFVLAVVGDLVSLNIFSIVSSAIGAAIAGYFLYEIRSFFVAKPHKNTHEKAAAK